MKQYDRSSFAHAKFLVVIVFTLSVFPSVVLSQGKSMVFYPEDRKPQRIYDFFISATHHLYVHYWDGQKWRWADQGTPSGTIVAGTPGAITYQEGTQPQRIYAFVSTANGHLFVNYWDGYQWRWADQGVPPGTTVTETPGVITYREGTQPQRIYAFVRTANGHLFVNYWDGYQWRWADQGVPPGTTVTETPGVITYREGTQPQRIYAFVRTANGHLFVNYWDGYQWRWADQGMPPGTTVTETPGVITYREGTQPQRIYAFVRTANGHLFVNYKDGYQWRWADQGAPSGTIVTHTPGVITYREGIQPQQIYTFVRTANGHLFVNYWDGYQWRWADQGVPFRTNLLEIPRVMTYKNGIQPQKMYVFIMGQNSHIFKNYWDGSQWNWRDQGSIDLGVAKTSRELSLSGYHHRSETLTDQCSDNVFISAKYSDKLDLSDGILLVRGSLTATSWSEPMSVNGHTWIRFWCHSTTGNIFDPGTWRFQGSEYEIGIEYKGGDDFAQGDLGSTVSFKPGSSAVDGWTAERCRCKSDRTRAIRARLGPDRKIEIECLE